MASIDVLVPGLREARPRLELLGRGCRDPELAAPRSVERTATHELLVLDDPGEYFFRVTAQDPRTALGDYQIHARFAALDAETPSRTKSGEDENPPDPAGSPLVPGGDRAAKSGEDENPPDPAGSPLSLAGDRTTKSGEDENPPDPAGSPVAGYGERTVASYVLCRTGEEDDHGDTFSCASALDERREVDAEIHNPWGDDGDVFRFTLSDIETVRIETTGELDTMGGLFDGAGRRLARDDDRGRGGNFRIVRTLEPGRYFVRVEGARFAEGEYTLHLERLGR